MSYAWLELRKTLQRFVTHSAVHNFGWLVAQRICRLLLSVVTGFFVARYLGPTRFGLLSYCAAWVALFAVLPDLGLEMIVKRRMIEGADRASQILTLTVGLRLATALAAAAFLALATWVFVKDAAERRLIEIFAVLLLQPIWLSWDHWFQARLEARASMLAQTGAFAIGAAVRVVLIVIGAPVTAFAAVATGESMLAGAVLIGFGRGRGLKLAWHGLKMSEMRELMAEAWPLFLSGVAVLIYMRIDAVMLKSMAGERAVGIYSAAVRLSELWYFLPVALASSLLPMLIQARNKDAGEYRKLLQRYYDLNAGCAYVIAIPTMVMASWLIRLAYGPDYLDAAPILAVHVWANLFVFLGVARSQFLVNERLQHFYLGSTVAGAIVNVALNLVLIPTWQGLGAAVATFVSYALSAWMSSYWHRATRAIAAMQTRALLLPVIGWRYCRRA